MRWLVLALVVACGPARDSATPPSPPDEETPTAVEPHSLVDDPWHFPGDCLELPTPAPAVAVLPVALEAGELLDLALDEGVDMALSLRRAGEEERLLSTDSPVDWLVTERLIFQAPESAIYEILFERFDDLPEPQPSLVRFRSLGPPSRDDLVRARAARLVFEAEQEKKRQDGKPCCAERWLEAAAAWGVGGEPERQALALYQAGEADTRSGSHPQRARDALSTALALFETQDNRRHQALSHYWLGKVVGRQGDLAAAIHHSRRALDLFYEVGNLREQATQANDLARLHLRRGHVHAATELYFEAIEAWEKLGKRHLEANSRTNLGICYVSRGAFHHALEQYRRAAALLDETQHTSKLAFTLTRLGDVLLELDGPSGARPILERALALRRASNDRRGEAITLNSLGRVALAEHRPQAALDALRGSLAIFLQLDKPDPWSELVVRNGLGRAYERLDHLDLAGLEFDAARTTAQEVGHPHARAEALYGLARLARRRGELDSARRHIERAIGHIEAIRDTTARQDLRSAFLAVKQDYYDFLVDLLSELHHGEPEAGHAAAAFVVAERARARSLLDTFGRVSERLEDTIDPELLARLTALREHLVRQDGDDPRAVHETPRTIGGPRSDPPSSRNRASVAEELERLRQAEAGRSERFRRYASWTRPTLYDPDRIRSELLDEETLVLSFHLGERRSFLWILDRGGMHFLDDLPPRAVLESAALEVFKGLRASHFETSAVAARLAAEHFTDLVLAPAAPLLGGRRLVISAPGVLEYVPFAALPAPRRGDDHETTPRQLLAERHEIVRLPSLSVLAALRRARAEREPAKGQLAVLADPVFGSEDPRLAATGAGDVPEPHVPLPRLLHSRHEAEALMALATGPTMLATGFEANRDTVLDGSLADYRIVHFATHGTFDTELPELSSLVLSRFDAEGRPVDGELRAYEIFTLRIPAELVVLSACRTALGRELRGEGLVGLARGFMEAGASRVLVSLWDVDDRATAELMRHFYRALFAGETASEALRQAQLELATSDEWSAPHYWAAFVLIGDWL